MVLRYRCLHVRFALDGTMTLCVKDSSAAWVCNSPNESLAFILHDAGYDVWLGNVRGSTWGLRHAQLTTRDKAFWEFSWDDMALHDLPAMCAAVLCLNLTGC